MDNEDPCDRNQLIVFPNFEKSKTVCQEDNSFFIDLKKLITQEVDLIIREEEEALKDFFDTSEKMEELRNTLNQETRELVIDVVKESIIKTILLRIQKAKKRAEREARRKAFVELHEKVDNELDKFFAKHGGKIRKRFGSDERIEEFKNKCRENSYETIEEAFKEELMKAMMVGGEEVKIKQAHSNRIDSENSNRLSLELAHKQRDLNEEENLNNESNEPPCKRRKLSL